MNKYKIQFTQEVTYECVVEAKSKDEAKAEPLYGNVGLFVELDSSGYDDNDCLVEQISDEEYDEFIKENSSKSTIKQLIELTEDWKDETIDRNLSEKLDNLLQQMYEIDSEM